MIWQKAVGAVLAVALLVLGIELYRGLSGETSAATRDTSRTAANVAAPVRSAAPSRTRPTPATTLPEESAPSEPATRGPAAAVWKVLGKPHAQAADEREELIAALKTASPCTEKWCSAGRDTVEAWVATMSRKVPALTASGVQCSSAGCWTRVAVNDVAKWHEVSNLLPSATMEKGWPGPTILGGPDLQTEHGTVIALWAVLPSGEIDASKGDN